MNHKRPKGNQFHNQFLIPLNKKCNNVIDINNNKICQDSITSARTRRDSCIRDLALTVPAHLHKRGLVEMPPRAPIGQPTGGGEGRGLARGCRESLVLHEFN